MEKASADAVEATKSAAHSAWIAMIAALVSAAVALGGTIIAGLIAANSASSTVAQQLSGETQKSQAEFRRGQQQAAYAEAATHAGELYAAELALNADLETRRGSAAYKLAFDRVYAAATAMESDEGTINLVASDVTRAKWADVIARHGELRQWLSKYIVAVADSDAKEFTEDRFVFLIAAAGAAENAFTEQARTDLGYK
jgi:hypothetical protein